MKLLLIKILLFLPLFSQAENTKTQTLNLEIPNSFFNNQETEMALNLDPAVARKQKLIVVVGNDGISGNLSDRHLTSQIKIGLITKRIPEAFQSYIEDNNYVLLTLTNDIYTPEDISNSELILDDSPYAGWLYLSLGSLKQTKNEINITTVDIGFVGPSAKAEFIQSEVHALIGSTQPNGWKHQLKDEFGIKIEHEKYFRTPFSINSFISGELLKFYGGTIGNVHTGLKIGGVIRVGRNIPNDLSVGINQSQNKNISVFGFIKVQGEYVLKNIFLDGNTFKDSHSVDKENFIAELTAGITFMKGAFGISLVQLVTTKEFKDQSEPDTNAEIKLVFDFIF